jgi:murein L,D-transpeptidase YafK
MKQYGMKRTAAAFALACLLLVPGRRASAGWTADIVDTDAMPPRFVAVDKNAQSFTLLSRQSPLAVVAAIPCTTGQMLGDKSKEGDLRTPEGVYFITTRKSAGLNYSLYGDLAFPLDFPNPADVLRRKSGHGIWIHGRGHAITPYETQGCVALSTPDIHRMDTELAAGMPVVIADEVRLGGQDAAVLQKESREVVAATRAWAMAWQDRSPAYFDAYDSEKFSITEGKPFSAFRNHKERLFKVLPWIKVDVSDVRAVPGPDYWVTYFVQLYRSPTLTTQGVKRLYWQRGGDGRFRIIGVEYDEMPVTLAGKGAAKPTLLAASEEADTETRKPDSKSEEETDIREVMNTHQAIVEKMAQKAFGTLALKSRPTPEDEVILEVARSGGEHPAGPAVATDALRIAPSAPTTLAQATPAPAAQPQQQPVAAAPQPVPARPVAVPAAPAPAAASASPAQPAVSVPVVASVPASQPTVAAHETASAPTPQPATPAPAPAPVTVAQATPPAAPAPQQPAAPAPAKEPAKPAAISSEQAARILAAVEGWRGAWEQGHMDAYLDFYTDDARQGNLRGKDAIRRQKQGVWHGTEPGRVTMQVVAAAPSKDGFEVVCAQTYQGKGGKESKGFKLLSLVPSGDGLRIAQERWSHLRPALPGGMPLPAVAAASQPKAATPPAPSQAAQPAPAPQAPKAASTPEPAKVATAPADRAAAAAAMVEAWRKAWESGNPDAYAAFYAEGAVQGNRHGRADIREDKVDLWKNKAPSTISFSDLKIRPRKDGYVVTCVQDYASKDGGSDHGRKTLVLAPSGNGFVIVEERWSRL